MRRFVLEATDQHTIETMLEIVGDTYSLVGEIASPSFLGVDREGLTGDAQALYDAIEAWEFTCPTGLASSDPEGDASSSADERTEALGCAAFHRVLSSATVAWYGDERSAADWSRSPTLDSILRALVSPEELTNPDIFWDNVATDGPTETKADILTAAFETGAALFVDQIGDDPTDWLWGRVHNTIFTADLLSSLGVTHFNAGPYAKDGGISTVNVSSPRIGSDSLNHGTGPSMRLICEAPSTGVRCSLQLPGGLPHFRHDPNYNAMIENWLVNEPVDLVFDHADLEGTAVIASSPE